MKVSKMKFPSWILVIIMTRGREISLFFMHIAQSGSPKCRTEKPWDSKVSRLGRFSLLLPHLLLIPNNKFHKAHRLNHPLNNILHNLDKVHNFRGNNLGKDRYLRHIHLLKQDVHTKYKLQVFYYNWDNTLVRTKTLINQLFLYNSHIKPT